MMQQINCHDPAEMMKLLTGWYPVRRMPNSPMDHEPEPLPTSVPVVLSDYVYKNIGCKPVFQDALIKLLSGSAEDVYLSFAYFDECIISEQIGIAKFKIDREILVPLLKKAIQKHAGTFSSTPVWRGGESRLEWIRKVSRSYQSLHGFTIICDSNPNPQKGK